jgi:glycerol dehydrogenase
MLSFGFPLVYHQGPGLIDRLGDFIHFLGARPLVVMGPFEKNLVGGRIEATLAAHSISPVFFNFEGEVSPENIDKAVHEARVDRAVISPSVSEEARRWTLPRR